MKTFAILLLFFTITTTFAQNDYRTDKVKKLQGAVVVNFDVTFERKLTKEEKSQPLFYNEVIVLFNKDKLVMRKVYPNQSRDFDIFTLLDYNEQKQYSCKFEDATRYAISKDFGLWQRKAKKIEGKTKTIAGIECQKYTLKVKGQVKEIYTTEELGLTYNHRSTAKGFALKTVIFDKKLGYITLKAKSITHTYDVPKKHFSLDGFTIYTKEEFKERSEEVREIIAEEKFERVGDKIPHLKILTLDDKKIDTRKNADHVMFFVFFYEKCNACNFLYKTVNELQEKYKNQKVEFLGVSMNSDFETEDFVKFKNIKFQVAGEGSYITQPLGIKKFPYILIVDPNRTIRYAKIGGSGSPKQVKQLDVEIEKALSFLNQ
ncbi:TlpA family protein disulfide reductase [Flammeovirga kamogawensis]|uniref:Redoxin domain-containing protein n=1 Tax=Flammeovirga kamogawensis TaxID=373891 RepID=A0ABX8H2E2_9BACT|nr:redoxin domain-containing protein [Flammeovirga kamogawensis]MBB6464059.1 peroxiredoxin [Flammeovirga kamogawensis]QWG09873.1 redoxin domain-containing protein [Flammeovirga kamogawensis]TRX65379.1 redoxin domain-containing protein [Flammeovirga kamogawensis]